MVWHGKEGWVGAEGLARPGLTAGGLHGMAWWGAGGGFSTPWPDGGRIEDASARPPHLKEDIPAGEVAQCGCLDFMRGILAMCTSVSQAFGDRFSIDLGSIWG